MAQQTGVDLDDLIPSILEPEDLKPNRTWARLIQKIYEVGPLTCPKYQGQMRILAFIEDEEVTIRIDCSDCQLHFLPLPSIRTRNTRWIPTGFQTHAWAVRGSEYLPSSHGFLHFEKVAV